MGDKKKIFIIIISILILAIFSFFNKFNENKMNEDEKSNNWLSNNVELIRDKSLGKNVYKVYKNSDISIFNLKYQKIITEKINSLYDDMEDDLVAIYNPYGTNSLSIIVLLKDVSYQEIKYEITSDKGGTFSKELQMSKNKNMYQLIGLSPLESNRIKLIVTKSNKSQVYEFTVDLSDVEINAEKKLEVKDGVSKKTLDQGLYAMLGNESDYKNYVALYDNDGFIRSEFPIKEGTTKTLEFIDNSMLFNISDTEIVKMNNLGEIINIYKTHQYKIESDYQIYNNKLYVLASDNTKETSKNCLIEVNLETNEVKEVICLDSIFEDYISLLSKEENSKLNYLDINSFTIVDDILFLSSRETSSIFKISNFLEEQPKLDYIVSNDLFWKNTSFSEIVLKKVGDFKIHAGQNSIEIKKDAANDKVYYIMMFNNNYGNSSTRKDFNYSDLDITNDNAYQGDNSYYYVYKIDEDNGTFELVDSISLEYSGLASNVQKLDNSNILINISTKGMFLEYDDEHNLIRSFKAKINKNFISSVEKYSFKNYWFS